MSSRLAELTSASLLPEELPAGCPICLVLGGERAGVAQEIVDLADCAVAIPMSGMANSLNVATAATILVHHAVRRASTRPNLTHP
jgi:tRNA G18 (ribose-2'-O)-methylase SpoU